MGTKALAERPAVALKKSGWHVASKREIASRLIEQDTIKLSPDGEVALKTVHQALLRALGHQAARAQ